MAQLDCRICTSAKGLKERMEIHKDNLDLIIEKIADYIAARETSRELQ